jgi:hypothetical protein
MFGAIKGYFFGNSSTQNSSNSLKENKPLKSDISSNNIDSLKNKEKKRTIIKGDKDKFDFSEEYDEDEPKTSPSQSENIENTENNSNESIKNNIINNEIELNSIQNIDNNNYWRMAHCIYVKGSLININTLDYVPFIKLKKKKEGILSYIGLGSESFDEVKYLVGFDEHFIYMIDLSKEENKDDNDAMKTIGNHYDITKISNIEIVEDFKRVLVTILFVLDNDVDSFNSKIKKFYLERQNALKFLKMLKAYLNNFKIKITYTDKVFGNINFNEMPKEEKIVETKEIKIDDDNEKEKEDNINNKNTNEKDDGNEKGGDEKKEKEEKEPEKEDEIFTEENVEENIVDDKKILENQNSEEKHGESDKNDENTENAEKQNKNLIDI